MLKYIKILNIHSHNEKVYFPEVLWACMNSLMGVYGKRVTKNKLVTETMKAVSWKYPDLTTRSQLLGIPLTLDYLCGNLTAVTSEDRSTIPAYEYLLIVVVQRAWRSNRERLSLLNKIDRNYALV